MEMMHPLAQRLVDTVRGFVRRGAPYALIDYPAYNNPGDAAIWLGSRTLLEALAGQPPDYVSKLRGFDARRCRREIRDGNVYFLGGGNFGDLYPKHHRRRLSAITALPGNPIVQLPISVATTESPPDDSLMEETAAVIGAHGSLTLIAREAASHAKLTAWLGGTISLAPDAAHLLWPDAPPPCIAEVRQERGDAESATGIRTGWDWTDIHGMRTLNRVCKLLLAASPETLHCRIMDGNAQRRVALAVKALARGQRVHTDRLHGMILAHQIGREVVARDNMTGKVFAYLETWCNGLPGVTKDPSSDN